MRKLLLLVVLALGACTTISAQRISRKEHDAYFRIARAKTVYDYNSGIKSEERHGIVTKIYTPDLCLDVYIDSVVIKKHYGTKNERKTTIPRKNNKKYTVAKGCTTFCDYQDVRCEIENDDMHTIVWFYAGSLLIKTYWINQVKPLEPRYGGYSNRRIW